MDLKEEIWIFNHYAGSPSNSTSLRHYNFARQLINNGYSVSIFAASAIHNTNKNLIEEKCDYITIDSEGVPFIYVKTRSYKSSISRLLNMLDYYRGLFKVARKRQKPGLILASSVHPLTLIAGIKIAHKFNIPCICEIRDLWPESFVAYGIVKKWNPILKFLYRGEKWIYKNADKLIFTMEGGKDYIIEKGWDSKSGGPVNLNKVYHINNGVDIELFDYNKCHFVIDDKDLSDESVFKVVYTGSIRFANNISCLVEAAKLLKLKGFSQVKILIWGDGDQREKLIEKAKKENLDNIIFKGYIDKSYIPGILSKADILFLEGSNLDLFRFGISPNKLFDYLASAKPILSVLTTNYDIILKYDCGTVTQVDSNTISDEIVKYVNMPMADYEKMCNQSRKLALRYDFRYLTQDLLGIIKSDCRSEKE